MSGAISSLTSARGYFEDFEVGQRMRHARGTTIGEVENQMVTKLVMNTADAHYNEHKARQTGERMLAGSEWQDEDLVFAQPNGRPIDKKVDYKNWRNLLREAGVRHVLRSILADFDLTLGLSGYRTPVSLTPQSLRLAP